jgi:hypothetical protein
MHSVKTEVTQEILWEKAKAIVKKEFGSYNIPWQLVIDIFEKLKKKHGLQ